MQPMRSVRRAALGLSLFVGAAFAAKECAEPFYRYPGIDEAGNLEYVENGADGTVKLCVNTKNGKFKGKGSAQVINETGATQKFANADFPQPEEREKLKYRVNKKGAAKLIYSGVVAT